MTHEYIGTKIVTAWPADKDGQSGYGVKYADGYTSWSPKEAFEAAYLDIGHVSQLPGYQQRMIGEKAQLDHKIEKLSNFLPTQACRQLSEDEVFLLNEQLDAMLAYSEALGKRIEAFADVAQQTF